MPDARKHGTYVRYALKLLDRDIPQGSGNIRLVMMMKHVSRR
jgi:hypothetical protein